jgi:hypothetical protein
MPFQIMIDDLLEWFLVKSFPCHPAREEICRGFQPQILKRVRPHKKHVVVTNLSAFKDLIKRAYFCGLEYLHWNFLFMFDVPENQIEVACFQLTIHNLKLILTSHFENLGYEAWLSEVYFN